VTTTSKPRACRRLYTCFFVLFGLVCSAPGETTDLVGRAQRAFERGDFNEAAVEWEKDAAMFRSRGDTNRVITTSLSLADAYQAIGQHRRAVQLLEDTLQIAEPLGKNRLTTLVRARLGAALTVTMQYEQADALLTQALEAAKVEGDSALASAILNDLGNSLAAQQKYSEALALFEEAVSLGRKTTNALLTAKALCNAGSTAVRAGAYNQADDLTSQALTEIERLEPVHGKAFLLLSAGLTDRDASTGSRIPKSGCCCVLISHCRKVWNSPRRWGPSHQNALGYLAQLYERDGQLNRPSIWHRVPLLQRSKPKCQRRVRWEWQSGRLLNARNQVEPAIAAYRRAVETLQSSEPTSRSGPATLSDDRRFASPMGRCSSNLPICCFSKRRPPAIPNESRHF
jgi:tetratricopeptide (TPR) repeat protein